MIPAEEIDARLPYSARGGRFWLIIVLVGAAFLSAEHHIPRYPWTTSSALGLGDDEEQVTEKMEVIANDGSWGTRIGLLMLGSLGVCLLVLRGPCDWNWQGLLPVLVLFVVAWCLASVIWADDMGRAGRRVTSLLLCLVGALGLAKQLSGRELCLLLLIVTAAYASIGVGIEVLFGAFRPWLSWYRLAGTLHPNGQAVVCALLCIGAAILARGETRWRWLYVTMFCAGAILLLATKSRTACLALAPALALLAGLKPSARVAIPFLVVVWLAGAALLVGLLFGANVPGLLTAALEMGRADDTGTLTGRTELWIVLSAYSQQRHWLGYGYGGFWTGERIQAISSTLSWGISSAHSSYLEAVLNVGLVGAAALALVVLGGLWRAATEFRATADPGAALLFALLTFGAIHGISESDHVLPKFVTFFIACGLFRVTFFRRRPTPREASPASTNDLAYRRSVELATS